MGEDYSAFTGSIPQFYDRFLVPLIFEPYAADLAARVRAKRELRALELACGTGVVTEKLARALGADDRLTASDLNPDMINIARRKLPDDGRVTWKVIDATSLPFDDGEFDAIVCQFGCMFFPDRAKAMSEARRVLRAGGQIVFNAWDRLDQCPVLATADAEIRAAFPADPPRFYEVPFGMFEREPIVELMRQAGFDEISVDTLRLTGTRLSARDIAAGIVRGGPFVSEIQKRGGDVDAVIERVARKLAATYGDTPFASPMSALVCEARVAKV
jgi:ubiquinone/menaquinone biosynthesis C-methylase UbiE